MGKIDLPHLSTPDRRPRADVLPVALPPRGINREQSAAYVGVSPTKFDEMVAQRLMPKAKRIGGRLVWSVPQLAIAFDALPNEDGEADGVEKNEWDNSLCGSSSKTGQAP